MYDSRMPQANIRINQRPVTDRQAAELAGMLTCLADPIRLRLFDLVRRAGQSGICSCDLTEPLDRSQPTVSHHLKVLREAGLVTSRRDGTWVWYSVVDGALEPVRRFLAH